MDTPKVFESEYRFCLILWEHEPIKSSELVNLCKEQLGWKPTTTYTVIKRLSERGVLKNENTIVSSLVSRMRFRHQKSMKWLKKHLKVLYLLLLQHLQSTRKSLKRKSMKYKR